MEIKPANAFALFVALLVLGCGGEGLDRSLQSTPSGPLHLLPDNGAGPSTLDPISPTLPLDPFATAPVDPFANVPTQQERANEPAVDPQPTDEPPPAQCPELAGKWEGTGSGSISGSYSATVEGTIWFVLEPALEPGNYVMTAGEMVAWPTGFWSFNKFNIPLSGQVNCGELNGTANTSILGVAITGTNVCTLTADSGQGIWQGGSLDGQFNGMASYQVQRTLY